MTTNIELIPEEESFLIAAVGRTVKNDVDMIRDWNGGKKAYSLDMMMCRVKHAKRGIAMMKKLAGEQYEDMLELFVLN